VARGLGGAKREAFARHGPRSGSRVTGAMPRCRAGGVVPSLDLDGDLGLKWEGQRLRVEVESREERYLGVRYRAESPGVPPRLVCA
jgi:hypothetical protein